MKRRIVAIMCATLMLTPLLAGCTGTGTTPDTEVVEETVVVEEGVPQVGDVDEDGFRLVWSDEFSAIPYPMLTGTMRPMKSAGLTTNFRSMFPVRNMLM